MRDLWELVRGRRNFRFVAGASLISLTGDWILQVGLVYRVYAITGAPLASALLMLAAILPQLALGSVAGVWADRWDRRRTMIATNWLMALLLVPLAFIHGRSTIWMAFPVAFAESMVQQLFAPAEQALLPTLVDEQQLVTANALNGQNQNIARLVGSALGGVAAAAGGIPLVAAADLASFVAAALLVAGVHVPALRRPSARPGVAARAAAVRREWAEGIAVIRQSRVLVALAAFMLITTIGEGDMGTLFAPFVRHVLGGSGAAYGLILSVQAVGGMLGGLGAALFAGRLQPARLLGWGALAFGALDLAIFLYPLAYIAVWPAVAGMLAVGLPGALVMAGMMTLYQQHTADAYRGRVWGAFSAAGGLGVAIGTIGAGVLAGPAGIIPVIAFQGVGYVGAGAAMMALLRHPLSPETANRAAADF